MASAEAMESIEQESVFSSKNTEIVSGGTKSTSDSSGSYIPVLVLCPPNTHRHKQPANVEDERRKKTPAETP